VRVFLDTNVLVSAVGTRGLCADVLQTVLAEHELVVGEAVLVELRRVLQKKMQLSPDLAREMDDFLRREAEVIPGAPAVSVAPRDPNDLPVLAEAVAGRIDVLVTGDRDLLELEGKLPFLVVNPRGFWEQLRADDAQG
jgi:putative PIN family toxin of toxin-antitoxin system